MRIRFANCAPLVAATTCILLGRGSGRAAESDVVAKPAGWDLVVAFAEHRFLTAAFQDQVREEIGDRVRLAFGDAVDVRSAPTHPLLPQVLARGLVQPLDAWDRVGSRHTAFVLVRYREGRYDIEARAHHGPAGTATALVRQATTADRRNVARLAAQLVAADLVPLGIVDGSGKDLRLALEGGQLGLDRRVKAGDVFAVAQIVREAAGLRAVRMQWVLLEAASAPRDGFVACKLWRRYAEDDLQPRPGVAHFVAVKLPASNGPLRLRFVDERRDRPLAGLALEVFSAGAGTKQELATDRDGVAISEKPIDRFAIVQVMQGTQVRTRLPIPLVADRIATVPLSAHPEDEQIAGLAFRRDLWSRHVFDDLALASDRVAELNRLLGQSLEEALAYGQAGLKAMDGRIASHAEEREQLRKAAAERGQPEGALKTVAGDTALEELRKRRQQLDDFVRRLEKTVEEAQNEQAKAVAQEVARARLLESQGDAEEALRVLDGALKLRPDQAAVREQAERLRKLWELKSPAHAEARKFLLKTWPRLEPKDFAKNLDEARRTLSIVRQAQDGLTLTKLRLIDAGHAVLLKKRLDAVRGRDDEEARAEMRILRDAAEGLGGFHAQVVAAGKKD